MTRAKSRGRAWRLVAVGLLAGLVGNAGAAVALDALTKTWPAADAIDGIAGIEVTFPSRSPFMPSDIGFESGADASTAAMATLFAPLGATAAQPVPAVIMLHGSGGVLSRRELTYGRQLAAMGIAALVVDAFAARRDRAVSFTDRLIRITETMLMADAYAGLRYLAGADWIDAQRVALIGFSYGGMATVFGAYEQVARQLAPDGLRFAAHVAFYAPCIGRFADNRTTGAPVLMLSGSEDEIVDQERCAEIADDLRAGGSTVQAVVYQGAYHQWDGNWPGPRRIGRNLAPCRLEAERDGTIRDQRTLLPMIGPLTRQVILGLCAGGEGYLMGRDDAVRERSNRDLGGFLARVFAR